MVRGANRDVRNKDSQLSTPMSYCKNYLRQLVLVALAGLCWPSASANDDQSDDQSFVEPPAATSHPTRIGPIANGFVFVHGQYVLLPYHVHQSDGVVSIAGEDQVAAVTTNSGAINVAIARCLWLIVGFATLDMIWRILAARAGKMRELNPLGSRFIQDPWLLTAAKVACTALAVGILHALRSHVAARRAAWWMCLVSALVAVRWVFLSGVLV